jgi:Cdc6-like AAA superfamily ATPase
LHGSTGCGKTSIVTELINYLKEFKPEFRVLYVNCLNFTSVRGIYSLILEHFFSQKDRKPEQALSNIFMDPSKINATVSDHEVNLIILDEIDQCFSSKTFIYNIL